MHGACTVELPHILFTVVAADHASSLSSRMFLGNHDQQHYS